MRKTLIVATGLAALSLAGCGGGGKGVMMVVTPPAAPPRIEDQFGAGFGTAFRTDRNVEPGEPTGGDIEALTLNTEPREIN